MQSYVSKKKEHSHTYKMGNCTMGSIDSGKDSGVFLDN